MNRPINSVIESIEKESFCEFWNISKEQAGVLESFVLLKNPENILEIGTSNGYSTLYLARGSKFSKITTVEMDSKRCQLAGENFKKAQLLDRITLIESEVFSYLGENKFLRCFDFIFVDAAQSKYFHLVELLQNCGAINCDTLLVFDNIISHKLDDFVEKMRVSFSCEVIPVGGGFLVSKLLN